MNSKTCNQCGQSKPITEFYRDCWGKDGRRTECRACKLRYNAENKALKKAARAA